MIGWCWREGVGWVVSWLVGGFGCECVVFVHGIVVSWLGRCGC